MDLLAGGHSPDLSQREWHVRGPRDMVGGRTDLSAFGAGAGGLGLLFFLCGTNTHMAYKQCQLFRVKPSPKGPSLGQKWSAGKPLMCTAS